jgi:type II secretory pathway component GspD/PulD (secretin)
MVPESGVYHIVPYAEAVAAKRVTSMVRLENAKAADVKKTLQDVLMGSPDATLVSISSNDTTNVLIVAGPEARVTELKGLAKDLDISKPVAPTVTEAIKLNNAEPKEMLKMVESMLSADVGKAAVDERSRHVVVTDMPVVVEQVRALVQEVDKPVRQVSIDAMIVDALLNDEAQTGADWLMESVRHLNRRGELIGNNNGIGLETDATGSPVTPNLVGPVPLSGRLAFSILSKDISIGGIIGAEVRAQKARLLANPVITTVENKKAQISITQEIPYQEFTQGLSGPPIATTAFKDIGIILEVTPRVTHDDYIIADLSAKQSDTKGELNNIPIEDKREALTTLRTRNGQTIFIGGLRRFDDENQTRRIPILGDIPVVNALFKSNIITKESTELLVFLTCNILPEDLAPLPLELEESLSELDRTSKVPDASVELGRRVVRPKIPFTDPAWKWRRAE